MVALAPASLQLHLVEIGELFLYNEDFESELPDSWRNFRETLQKSDGIIVVTPEYNRTMPGGLKNAFDVGSRPFGESVWSGKPAGIISVSPGPL